MRRNRSALRSILVVGLTLLTLASLSGVASSAMLAPGPDHEEGSAVQSLRSLEPALRAPRHEPRKERREVPKGSVVAHIPHDLNVTARPGGGRVIGTMPSGSRFFDEPLRAWVLESTKNGKFGKVTLPYSGSRATGWIRLAGLNLGRIAYSIEADLSSHSVTVMRMGKVVMHFKAATGAPDSPTPTGRYFVTDLVPIPEGGSFGSYAFGLSGIQTNLPAGWTGGDQLAIHGTDDPGSIGTSASAGCLRVSESALQKLQRIIQLGTPVTIAP